MSEAARELAEMLRNLGAMHEIRISVVKGEHYINVQCRLVEHSRQTGLEKTWAIKRQLVTPAPDTVRKAQSIDAAIATTANGVLNEMRALEHAPEWEDGFNAEKSRELDDAE